MDGEFFFYAGLGCFGVVLGIIVWAYVTAEDDPWYGWADGRLEDMRRQDIERKRLARRDEMAARNGIRPQTYGLVHPAPIRPPILPPPCVDIETSFNDHNETVVQFRRRIDHDGPGAA